MRYLTSNLYFAGLMILGISMLFWYVLNDTPKSNKKSILSTFMDVAINFIGIAFVINLTLHVQEVINFPYRILIFSSNEIALATFAITIYSTIKYGKKLLNNPQKSWSVGQLFILLGFVNHVYLYIQYRNLRPLIFIAFFMALLVMSTVKSLRNRINGLLMIVISGVVHFILMGKQPIVYFNFTFYRLPLALIVATFVTMLFIQRRNNQSTLN